MFLRFLGIPSKILPMVSPGVLVKIHPTIMLEFIRDFFFTIILSRISHSFVHTYFSRNLTRKRYIFQRLPAIFSEISPYFYTDSSRILPKNYYFSFRGLIGNFSTFQNASGFLLDCIAVVPQGILP